jgi:hypothetical protein
MKRVDGDQAGSEQGCSSSKRAKVEERGTSPSLHVLHSTSAYRRESSVNLEEEQEEEKTDWSSRAAYRDTLLALGDNSNIRVLTILPEKSRGHIACRLSVIPVGSDISFTAVSYVWGDRLTRSIVVNERPLGIRENLWQFLYQMHQEGRSEYFWIDAICINQFDTQERNHQVAMMGKIYATASQVLVWLGPQLDIPRHKRLFNAIWIAMSERSHTPRRLDESRQLLFKLSANEYWERTWILQEFVLAQRLEIRSGPDTLDENVLHQLCNAAAVENDWDRNNPRWRRSASSVAWLRRTWGDRVDPTLISGQATRLSVSGTITVLKVTKPCSLIDLVHTFSTTKCKDPRDHVYALLSLASREELEHDPIVPDYSISATQLLLMITQRMSKQREIAQLLESRKEEKPENYEAGSLQFSKLQTFRTQVAHFADVLGLQNPDKEVDRVMNELYGNSFEEIFLELQLWYHSPSPQPLTTTRQVVEILKEQDAVTSIVDYSLLAGLGDIK